MMWMFPLIELIVAIALADAAFTFHAAGLIFRVLFGIAALAALCAAGWMVREILNTAHRF